MLAIRCLRVSRARYEDRFAYTEQPDVVYHATPHRSDVCGLNALQHGGLRLKGGTPLIAAGERN
jgi:hypothetical protein